MNFEKYRKMDTIKLEGVLAEVFQETEKGELVEPSLCKDADWLTGKSVNAKAETFDFEDFVLKSLNSGFMYPLKCKDICICGSCLSFWKTEDADGEEFKSGELPKDKEYHILYTIVLKINGQNVEEEDLHKILPNFDY